MENCTIYSHHLQFDKVVDIVKKNLPKASVEVVDNGMQKGLTATIKGGLFSKSKTLKINYRQRENPSYQLEKIDCALTQNLSGMVNFIKSIPAQNKELQSKFLMKVMAANCEMPFMAEPNITPEFASTLKNIITDLDAFVFTAPNKQIGKSDAQHFLDNNLNLILDTNGVSGVDDISVNVDAKYRDQAVDTLTEDQKNRKNRSIAFLNTKNVKISKSLPTVESEEEVILRSKTEVLDRAFALLVIAAIGEGVTREQVQKPIADKKINSFTPQERLILEKAELTDQDKANAVWRYESLYVLMWSLGLMPELKYPSDICDVPGIVGKLLNTSREETEAAAVLKSKKEILDELDKTYRMHWACVEARIKGEQVSGDLNASVVYERHYALNWLTNHMGSEWDNVETHT